MNERKDKDENENEAQTTKVSHNIKIKNCIKFLNKNIFQDIFLLSNSFSDFSICGRTK